MAGTGDKRRIAILGGGQAALTAALQLTDPANPNSACNEVTIHQIGWRLGGKGATGRPVDVPWAHMRIEEHGFHAWFGFYDNSFRQIRTVYAELDRDSDLPLSTFEEAFEPFDRSVYVEQIEGRPLLWTVDMPRNVLQPGEGGLLPTPLQLVYMVFEAVEGAVAGSGSCRRGARPATRSCSPVQTTCCTCSQTRPPGRRRPRSRATRSAPPPRSPERTPQASCIRSCTCCTPGGA
jgi:hypothetical protein